MRGNGCVVGQRPGSGVSATLSQALAVSSVARDEVGPQARPAGSRRRKRAGEAGLDLSKEHMRTQQELELRGQLRLTGF